MAYVDRFPNFSKYGFSRRRYQLNDCWIDYVRGNPVFPKSDDLSSYVDSFELIVSPKEGSEKVVLDMVLSSFPNKKDLCVRFRYSSASDWELSNERIVVPVVGKLYKSGFLNILSRLDVVPNLKAPSFAHKFNDFLYFREGTLLSRIIRKDCLDDHFIGDNYSLIKK